jgi:hypothetical protein
MPFRLEDAAEIVSAALIVHAAEIESASVNKGDAWASKVDADTIGVKSMNGHWKVKNKSVSQNTSFDSYHFVTRHFGSGHCCCNRHKNY